MKSRTARNASITLPNNNGDRETNTLLICILDDFRTSGLTKTLMSQTTLKSRLTGLLKLNQTLLTKQKN